MTRTEATARVIAATRTTIGFRDKYGYRELSLGALREALAAYDNATPDSEEGWRPISEASETIKELFDRLVWLPGEFRAKATGNPFENGHPIYVFWDGQDDGVFYQKIEQPPLPAPPAQEPTP